MAQDYTTYLAAHVLNDQQIISYRLLSRALKVHVNLAKQMLYDFHDTQNAKKPNSVHATYLIAGTRRIEPAPSQTNGTHSQDQDGEDTVMRSSPPLPSSSLPQPDDESQEEPTFIRSIMLVKQEHLDRAKTTFDAISSIHIYSLESHPLNDVQVLTECNRKVAVDYASEDPLEAWKQYGTIQNPNTKRRTRRNGPPPPAPVAAPVIKKEDAKTKQTPVPTTKEDSKPSTKPETNTNGGAAATTKPAQTKRQNSDIFKSFSKSKTKPKTGEGSEASPASEVKDEAMGGFSDDDDGDEEVPVAGEVQKPTTDSKSKKERAAELQAMMDAEEDEDDHDNDEEMADADADTNAADAEIEEPEVTLDKAPAQEDEPKETVTVENGRRRGRRRVMKKRTVKDEEGYLVTKEEAAWESFSEDEPPQKKAKLPSAAASTTNKGVAAQKKAGKPGQGNIMSFFGKK